VFLYDFDKKTTEEVEYDLKYVNEKFIESYSYNDICYVFTLGISDKKLKQWSFDINGNSDVKILDFTEAFQNAKQEPVKLYDFLFSFPSNINMTKVDNTIPNNLEITCQPNKMYENDNGFIWTLDKDKNHTIYLEFSLPDLEPKIQFIKKPELSSDDSSTSYKTNSYLFEDKIAQISSNNQILKLDIKPLNNLNTNIKSLSILKQDTIQFKNSAILQEGSVYSFGETRKIEKTSKFLRKTASEKNGISIYKTTKGYQITIGGIRKQNSGGAPLMPGFGGFGGGIPLNFNPVAFSYGVYGSTGSTRIECLFDEKFNHIKGRIEENIFDRINAYEKDNTLWSSANQVFLIDNKFIYGYYDTTLKTYKLLEFN